MCLPQKQFTDVLQNDLKGQQLYWKETPKQAFSCRVGKIFKNNFFTEHLWWQLLSAKQIKRNKKIFYEKMFCEYFCWNIMTQRNRIVKFNESVFRSWNIIILKLWKTKLEKRRSSCAFSLVIATRYFLEYITVLKSDYQFYKWSSVTFQKMRASVREKKN